MDSIIFDVDGTLWDSADSVAAAWNLAIKKFSSLDITLDREILGSVFGKTMTDIGDILFPSLSETKMIFYEMFDTDCLHCCFDISALTVADNKKRVFFRKLFNSVSDSFINDSGMIF